MSDMDREDFWGILQSRRGSYLRAYLLWIAYFLVCASLKDWWYAGPAAPPFWELSLNIADSMFAPAALGIPASIFMVEAVWDSIIAIKRKGETLMGMIFKNLPNKWILKGIEQGLEQGREQEYKRMAAHFEEQARKQGIEYTPPPPPERVDEKQRKI